MNEQQIVNSLRVLSSYMITNAKSGHPGVALGASPIFYSVFKNMKTDYKNLDYFNRDYFVASAGHASSLLYATMFLFDLGITKKDLKDFRKINSNTPGHPEITTKGIDCATGPLGQGVSNAVGISLGLKHLQAKFNKPNYSIFNNYVYCFLGDGCMMEGISNEAFSLAGSLKLDNLIFIYDRNRKTIEGNINSTFTDDIIMKFKAMHFNTIVVKDGNNISKIDKAILKAKKLKGKPTLIIVDTLIGFGSHVQDNEISHGKPFSAEQIENLKRNLQVDFNEFDFPENYLSYCKNISEEKHVEILSELDNLNNYKKDYPNEYVKLMSFLNSDSSSVLKGLKDFSCNENLSPREINHDVLNFVAKKVENIIGGTADVGSSTLAYIEGENYINESFANRNIHFGVREHAMAGICNGLALTHALIPYCSCYLSFSDYCKNAIRMSALMDLPVFYQFSHDDILVGEDGPTHQPVEQLVGLRAMPNLMVFRPYNESEVVACYDYFFRNKKPTCIVLSKQKIENCKSDLSLAKNGGYILKHEDGELIGTIISTGIQVETALKVASKIKGLRVVSMPCIEIFNKQSDAYKKEVLGDKKRIILEALCPHSFYNLITSDTLLITNSNFGKSGNPSEILKEYGFDENSVEEKIKKFLK